MDELLHKLRSIITLSPEAEEYIKSISKIRVIKKGEILIRQGQSVKKTFYVNSGSLISYCIDKDGKKHTLQFAIKGWWISDFIAIYNNELATLTVESITETEAIEFDSKQLDEIYTVYPEFEAFQRKNLQRHVVSLHKRILSQLQLSAAERYDVFLAQYPDMERNIPNYHIASYLGITQESLSRIRVEKSKK